MSLNSCLYLGNGTIFRSLKIEDSKDNNCIVGSCVNSSVLHFSVQNGKRKICFIDNFPSWIADLQLAAPFFEFVVCRVEQILPNDIVIVDKNSSYNMPNAIVATGKKHLWRKLCEIMANNS